LNTLYLTLEIVSYVPLVESVKFSVDFLEIRLSRSSDIFTTSW